MKRVFISGIAGFIGYHLAKRLLEDGVSLVGCDNFNSYYPPELKEKRASELTALGAPIKRLDLSDLSSLSPLFEREPFTHFVHLAAQAGVRYSLTHPQLYIEANLNGFLQVLEMCRRFPDLKLVYASSSSVYGESTKIPLSEADRTDSPVSLYAATKKSNELMAHAYHHLYKFSAIGLRFFTVYGPWGRPDMAYYSFAKAISEGRPIEVYNGGNMLRDFTYVDDTVNGIIASLNAPSSCEIFNLGKGHGDTLGQLIELIEQELHTKATLIYKPIQPGDVVQTWADLEKSKKILGYNPTISLEEGIPRFIRWFRSFH